IPPVDLTIDFTKQPQRSGALVAPRFTVDAISRTLGPVTEAALPRAGVLPNLAAAYDGATLFGFPLSSLINLADVPGGPAPPSIVPIVENGQPIGVRMTWENLKLTSHESFHTRPPSTTMTLTVERSREKTTTECTLSNFDLVLPPSGTTLLTLTFGS